MSKLTYRPEIDGLRALAVLSVLFYHAGLNELSGGYVGVDIFFVISGFLITSIIHSELEAGKFSFKNFWIRRARRILPAALAVMCITAIIFAFVYPDAFYRDFGKSLSAQSIFSANIFFWRESGYFESAAELKPLLHTWSLAVEEQFYFIFPFILWFTFTKLKPALHLTLIIGCLLSFAISIWGAFDYPEATFYLLPARAWELGAGALLGITRPRFFSSNISINNIVATSGLAMIIVALFNFDKHTPFPSYNAALPVLGTCALIWANTNTRTYIGRFFSLKPIVGIGLISYSLYLWHWPVIVFCNWVFGPNESFLYTLLLLSISSILAYLSYKFIETPIRLNRKFFTTKKVIQGAFISSIVTFSAGILIALLGNSAIVDPDGSIEAYYLKAIEPESNRENCSGPNFQNAGNNTCTYLSNQKSDSIDIFIWGDSHGSALVPAFVNIAKTHHFNIQYATRNGCQPVLEMKRVDSNFKCPAFNKNAIQAINNSKPKIVVLVGSFVNNLTVGKYRSINSSNTIDTTKAQQEFTTQIKATISQIKDTGAKAVVFTEPPRLSSNPVNNHLRKQTLGLQHDDVFATKLSHKLRINNIYTIIDEAGFDMRLDYSSFFCNEKKCITQYKDNSLYKDASHISNFGANTLAPLIETDLRPLLD
jgi:peptidoglycan/LPS O-acetylase OafA/YrhL